VVAEISAALVRDLRERTGAGMMDCKKALTEAGGDLPKAVELLRERGLSKARGRLGRATSEGRIAASISDDGRSGALLELSCETDFVARTPEFERLAQEVAAAARDGAAPDPDALAATKLGSGTVGDRIVAAASQFGENIQVRRFARLAAQPGQRLYSYIHAGGKLGSMVQLETGAAGAEADTLGRNLCMHVTAANPLGVSRDDLPTAEVAREREVVTLQAQQEGKPANVLAKMVEGRMGRFFREVVLLEQPLVMDPDTTVESALKAGGARVIAFRRFQLGEEIGP
jgi:elongation factor Ts